MADDHGSQHPVVALVRAAFSVAFWILAWTRTVVAFCTITIPRFVYSVLSYSLTLRLDFTSLALLFVFSGVALTFFIRYRYLNSYSTLREVPLAKPNAVELHPDIQADHRPRDFHNYLDEFLLAVRVFGFLEKPVFAELARHLQTRRLIAGDTLQLDQDKNFYCVVDGLVQVYARTDDQQQASEEWLGEDLNGYHLLNEVGSGGTLSSLFTILSLFTENVHLAWPDPDQEMDEDMPVPIPAGTNGRPDGVGRSRANSDISQLDLTQEVSLEREVRLRDFTRINNSLSSASISSNNSTVHGFPNTPGSARPSYSMPSSRPGSRFGPLSSGNESPQRSGNESRREFRSRPSRQPTMPAGLESIGGSIARATVDTTLAVIPAEAFRRLTSKHPKMILSRFSRVTFNVAHKYLGLTTELLRTEKAVNELSKHPLPAEFYQGGGMQRLRQRFAPDPQSETDMPLPTEEAPDYFTSKSPANEAKTPKPQKTVFTSLPTASPLQSPLSPFRPRSQVNAGDLLSMAGSTSNGMRSFPRTTSSLFVPSHNARSRSTTQTSFGRPSRDNLRRTTTSDFDLKDGVMDCIAKSIGLIQPPISGVGSPEASPALAPTDPIYGGGGADDASSMTGASSMFGRNEVIENEVEILFFKAGDMLVQAGERNGGLFYIIDGFLDVSIPMDESEVTSKPNVVDDWEEEDPSPFSARRSPRLSTPKLARTASSDPQGKQHKVSKHLFTVKNGGIAGYFSSLSGIASYVDIRAKTDTYVGFLSHSALERLLEKRPIVLLTLAKRLISLLSPLVLQIDASLDWMQVDAGQVLWRPEDASDSFYIVINGRLRDLAEKNNSVSIIGEYGQGDTVGELDVITSSKRSTTLHAIRDSELVRMPVTLFNAISVRNPRTTIQLLRLIATRVRDTAAEPDKVKEKGSNLNLKTVAILPSSKHVPVADFAKKLQTALEDNGAPTSYLTQAAVTSHLGRHAFTKMGKLKVANWLADLEQRYRILLYVADSAASSQWTQTCIRQADFILVVGMGDDPTIGEYERILLSAKTTARKELVLLHPQRFVVQGSTREWLKLRPWIYAHFHVEMPGLIIPKVSPSFDIPDPAAVLALKKLRSEVKTRIDKYRAAFEPPHPQRPPHSNDFARLARRLCGKSFGIVLGGGGARGISHLGVLRALEEEGIPIDQIGGTSIGAFVSGLYACEGDLISSIGRAKQFSRRMGNVWRILSDLTYPIVAYTTGHEFNRSIYKAFYDTHIEDMWLPYFCNTTNILTSTNAIHTSGYAWRYIRASMTLAGLLPPLADNGNVLVDGGYMDNLPVTTMASMGASTIFAVDVGAVDDTTPRNFGDSVSGWWLLFNRFNPFAGNPNIPVVAEIQSRLAYVSSVTTLENAKVMKDCWYMPMPVQDYGTLQFNKYEEIMEIGYKQGKKLLAEWKEAGTLPSGFEEGYELAGMDEKKKKGRSLRRNSI
ncbi:patatin-domain-containing protein [Clavulina sp. PMI_390]|nr:patatin-domain-containing protein [Clavulina sp. PMI_390]